MSLCRTDNRCCPHATVSFLVFQNKPQCLLFLLDVNSESRPWTHLPFAHYFHYSCAFVAKQFEEQKNWGFGCSILLLMPCTCFSDVSCSCRWLTQMTGGALLAPWWRSVQTGRTARRMGLWSWLHRAAIHTKAEGIRDAVCFSWRHCRMCTQFLFCFFMFLVKSRPHFNCV